MEDKNEIWMEVEIARGFTNQSAPFLKMTESQGKKLEEFLKDKIGGYCVVTARFIPMDKA